MGDELTSLRALSGFILSLTPLSCTLMGWRGAGGSGAANVGVYVGFGGVLMILGSVGEVSLLTPECFPSFCDSNKY